MYLLKVLFHRKSKIILIWHEIDTFFIIGKEVELLRVILIFHVTWYHSFKEKLKYYLFQLIRRLIRGNQPGIEDTFCHDLFFGYV